jgi:flagellar export protein FliJ
VSRAFRFRLEPVLDLRRRREELLQLELAQALRAAAEQQERAVAAERVLQDAVAAMRGVARGTTQLLDLRASHDEVERMRAVVRFEWETARRLEEIAVQRRDDLVLASQEKEALVSLRRRDERAHRVEAGRQDQLAMDELATRRAARAARVAGPAGATA